MNLFQDIFTYAVRGSGKYVWFFCVVLSVVAKLVGLAPLVGLIAQVLLFGYFCAIYYQMIQSSAVGGSEAPEFPETSNLLEDIVLPMVQIILAGIVSFGPLLGYIIWAGEKGYSPAVWFGLLGFGIVYFPMAVLAMVVLGYTGAIGPHIVLPAVVRGGWLYGLSVAMLCALYVVESLIGAAMAGSFLLGPLVKSVVGGYVLLTNARMLGVVYRERQDELGWL